MKDDEKRKTDTMGTRPERVQEAIRQETAKIIQQEIKDPRLGFLTITGVELTKDLRFARVYFTVLGEDKDRRLALKGLKSAKGFLKGRLADEIKLRFMPELEFMVDESLARTKKVYDIIDKLHKEKEEKDDAGRHTGDTEA